MNTRSFKHRNMSKHLFKFLGICAFGFTSLSAQAEDPCNFASQLLVPSEQALECFRQVPFDPSLPEAIGDAYNYPKQASDLIPYYRKSGKPLRVRADIDKIIEQIKNTSADNDFDLHQKITKIAKTFKSSHWDYRIPQCYQQLLPAIPLTISSRLERGKQVVYFKDTFALSDSYAQMTGVDVDALVGQTIVKINNKPAMKAILNFARDNIGFSSFDGNLFSIALNYDEYNLIDSRRNPLPENLNPTYTLRDSEGAITHVQLPWAFLNLAFFQGSGFDINFPTSTSDFVEACQAPWSVFSYFSDVDDSANNADLSKLLTPKLGDDDKKRKKMRKNLRHKSKHFDKYKKEMKDKYQPMPFNLIEDALDEGGVSYGQLGEDTTVIKVITFAPEDLELFVQTVTNAKEYACSNSDTLMIDYSENGGGLVVLLNYLVGLLNPDLSDGKTYMTQYPFPDQSRSRFTNFLNLQDTLAQGSEPCTLLGSTCWRRAQDDSVILNWSDMLPEPGTRGKENILLTERIYFDTFGPANGAPYDSIPQICPGKFTGKNFIQILDGAGASGGAIAPGVNRDVGVNVGYHGLINKKLWFGFSQGGIVQSYHSNSDLILELLPLFGVPQFVVDLVAPLVENPRLPVRADFRYEGYGSLLDTVNPNELFVDQKLLPDIRVNLWDDDVPDVFYSEIYRAVKKHHKKKNKHKHKDDDSSSKS